MHIHIFFKFLYCIFHYVLFCCSCTVCLFFKISHSISLFDYSGISALNDVIKYLYNHQRINGRERKDYQNDQERGEGKRGTEDEQGEETVGEKNEKIKNFKKLKITLIENTVRAYVHGLCAISLKATQALGDLHLVDKAEQSKKNDGKLYLFISNFLVLFNFCYLFYIPWHLK